MKKNEPKVFTPEVVRRISVSNRALRIIRSLGYTISGCSLAPVSRPVLKVSADPEQSLMPLIRNSKTFWESKGGLQGIIAVPGGEVMWKIAA